MYNTDFIVKYQDIQKELVLKLKKKTEKEYEENPDNEYEYSSKDVLDICDKLYRDELCSVFYAENILDDKIDEGMTYVLEKMLVNSDFKNIIDKMRELLYLNETCNSPILSEEHKNNIKENYDLILLITLFSKHIFYITHKCICQQINKGGIDNDLIQELRENTITVLKL
jgi:hypothetical protein